MPCAVLHGLFACVRKPSVFDVMICEMKISHQISCTNLLAPERNRLMAFYKSDKRKSVCRTETNFPINFTKLIVIA